MTYLDWGCEPLEEECQSCLDALCNVCNEGFRKKPGGMRLPVTPVKLIRIPVSRIVTIAIWKKSPIVPGVK
jgi:hypothetical protein